MTKVRAWDDPSNIVDRRESGALYGIKQQMLAKRGSRCEACGKPCLEWDLEMHHCLFHRSRGHPELDAEENLELVCRECHAGGWVNSFEHRREFWDRQQARGYDMVAWIDGLPLKVKPRFGDPDGA